MIGLIGVKGLRHRVAGTPNSIVMRELRKNGIISPSQSHTNHARSFERGEEIGKVPRMTMNVAMPSWTLNLTSSSAIVRIGYCKDDKGDMSRDFDVMGLLCFFMYYCYSPVRMRAVGLS